MTILFFFFLFFIAKINSCIIDIALDFILCCSVALLHLTLCDPMDSSTSVFPVLYHLLELAQTHIH